MVLLTSESSGLLWTVCVWDYNTGTTLMTYKGGVSAPRSLSLLGQDYLISGISNKPLIHLWALQRKDQIQQRMVVSGPVSALSVSPDGHYCVAAVAEKIHLWQVCTGNLLAVLSRHYQSVTCLKFTDDGSHFVSAGEDNLVLAWSMSSIFLESSDPTKSIAPKHVWSDHSLAVTDLHIGYGGPRARVVTASIDMSCRLWELVSGRCLCTVMFDVSLHSVCMDSAESRLFAGGADGNIYQVNLFERPARTERHVENTESNSLIFKGHSKKVKCLCVSLDGSKVISGSDDFTVRVWDVASHQCLRTLNHKGAVNNVSVVPTPHKMFNHESKSSMPVQPFQRHLHLRGENTAYDEDKTQETVNIRIKRFKEDDGDSYSLDTLQTCAQAIQEQTQDASCNGTKRETNTELKEKIQELKQINSDMYEYSISHIFKRKKTNKNS